MISDAFRKTLALLSAIAFSLVTATAQVNRYGPVNVSAVATSGDKIRGPATVILTGLNVVRYKIVVGINVTSTPGPDITTLGLIPSIPKSGQQNNTAPATTNVAGVHAQHFLDQPAAEARAEPLESIEDIATSFQGLVNHLNHYERDRFDLQTQIQTLIDNVNGAKGRVEAFVSSSDAALRTDPSGTGLLVQIPYISNNVIAPVVAPAPGAAWPTANISSLEGKLVELKDKMSALTAKQGWPDWSKDADHRAAYDRAVTRINELIALVAAMDSSTNQSVGVMRDSQNKLSQWKGTLDLIQGVGLPSFTQTVSATCGFSFSNNKESKIEVASTDRLAPAGTAASKQEIVTVVCSSPLTVSAGFGVAKLEENNFAFVQSAGPLDQTTMKPTVVSKFGLTSQSNFRVVPAILINTRLWEPNDTIALHFSTGAAVTLSSGAVGNEAEYIFGASLSIHRSFLLTIGGEVGRESALAGGFNVGDVVPSSLSSPPIRKKWAIGPAFLFTYIIR